MKKALFVCILSLLVCLPCLAEKKQQKGWSQNRFTRYGVCKNFIKLQRWYAFGQNELLGLDNEGGHGKEIARIKRMLGRSNDLLNRCVRAAARVASTKLAGKARKNYITAVCRFKNKQYRPACRARIERAMSTMAKKK